MKTYGKIKKKAQYCTSPRCCGPDLKEGLKRRERNQGKKQIRKELTEIAEERKTKKPAQG